MDTTLLKVLLQKKINERGVSIREAARQMGVAHTTITRFLDGTSNAVDIDTFLVICKWMGVSPASMLQAESDSGQQLANALATIAEMYPEIFDVMQGTIDRIKAGELDPRTVADVLAYLSFRMGKE